MFKINAEKAADIERKRNPLHAVLDAIFVVLPVEVRAQFYPLKAAIKLAIEVGDIEAAMAIIQGTPVPPDLQAVKDAMLASFPQP